MLRLGSIVGCIAKLAIRNSAPGTPAAPQVLNTRPISFFVKVDAKDLWKSVTSVSNAGRKRGRASGNSKKTSKDLNKGQKIGEGTVNMVWPGLNAPIVRGREIVKQGSLPPDLERTKRILALRDKQPINFRRLKLNPMERGWSGTKAQGRSLGPPDPIGGSEFPDFNSVILSLRLVSHMTGHLGRVRRHKAIVAVGNGKGLLGFADAKASVAKSALRRAKNKAFQRLCFYERFKDHTVLHDFITEYGCTRIVVTKKERGFGLICHRALRDLCKLIGIKACTTQDSDMYAKVDTRNTNMLHLIRAFLLGLQKQKSHQDIAEEKRLHVVEFRPERSFFPEIIASPKNAPVRTSDEIGSYEELDINRYISGGKMIIQKPKKMPFYTRLPGWEIHLRKTDNLKNERMVRLRIFRKYGELKSFLNVRYEQKQPLMQKGANGELV
ncbi:28S ribosomal protein S5 [Tropilaelaps mercedesae]|uniref:Small ribosomal subunit protein uS5m n=1 Tax=Tropilaelaps mercedesae TaxID=418985 RepID=A0A1V9XJ10_9ACAR|nr:28S ribosomal protein S5 [Tropilaelaps mercedesae]